MTATIEFDDNLNVYDAKSYEPILQPNVERLGPDATFKSAKADKRLIEARLKLVEYLDNPPDGSVPMEIDEYMAEAMLERNPDNRNLRKDQVRKYTRIIQTGQWQHNGDSIRFSQNGLLGDGQHRLRAVIASGMTILTDVRFGLPNDIIKTIDTGTKRTASDYLQINKYKNPNVCAAIARLFWAYHQPYRMTKDAPSYAEIEDILINNALIEEAAVRTQNKCYSHASDDSVVGLKTPLVTASIVGLVWVLASEYNRVKADEFFRQVVTGMGISSEDSAAGRYRTFAINDIQSTARISRDHRLAILIKAWNAHATGKKLKNLRWIKDEAFPVAITKK